MAEDTPPPKPPRPTDRRDERARRQAEALRANLRRRKALTAEGGTSTAPLPPQRIG